MCKKEDREKKMDWKDYIALSIAMMQTVLARFLLLIVATIIVGILLMLFFSI